MKPMATRGLPATSIEQRSAAAQDRMVRKNTYSALAEWATGAIAVALFAGVLAWALAPEESPEVEVEYLLDRKGYRACWLEAKGVEPRLLWPEQSWGDEP